MAPEDAPPPEDGELATAGLITCVEEVVRVSGQMVVETGVTEVAVDTDVAGQLVTEDGQLAMVMVSVESTVEMDTAGNSSTTTMCTTACESFEAVVVKVMSLSETELIW